MGAIGIAVIALIALVLSGGALIVATNSGSDGAVASSSQAAAAEPETVAVSLSEFSIGPDAIEVAAGSTLAVSNAGAVEHDLVIEGQDLATPMLASGDEFELDLSGLAPGTYEMRCTVPGHDSAGMTGTLTITEGGAATSASHDDAGHSDAGEMDWAAMDQAMHDSIMAFPAETEGVGNLPLEPEEILEDGTKVFRLIAEKFDWEVEPGNVVEAWGYNGQVPGPAIHVDVGDNVRIHVENHLPMGHDVHWHGIAVPFDQDGVAPITQPLIQPGETFTYEFRTREPALGMYHPHNHGQMKLPNGMFGRFTVGDLGDDLPLPTGRTIGGREIPEDIEVVKEVPMVLNDSGAIGYSLNGKSFPATEPIEVNEGDWFVVHYYNKGVQYHPMHMHQFPQLVFAKDGFPLDSPRWEDTVNVGPGERYSVLVHASDPGIWMFHCHVLTHAERHEGMFGMVTAVIVDDA